MTLSVIIPTYKRLNLLRQAFQSLQEQSCADFEIVIVDNADDPMVAHMLKDMARGAAVPVTFISEPTLGAHHARHAGARVATGDLLLFGDDDQIFDSEWVAAYARAFDNRPEMVAAGGPIRPRWETTPPKWMNKFMTGRTMFPILGLMDLADEFRLNGKGIIFSGNMAIRRTALFELGGFGPDLAGEKLLGNGETGLNHKLWEREMPVGYVPDAIVYHHIPTERMTLEYFRQRMSNEGTCDMYTRFHKRMPCLIGLLAYAASIIIRNCALWLLDALLTGRTDRMSLRVQLQSVRSRAQLKYVSRLMQDKNFRKFVLKRDWLNAPCTSR